MKHFWERRKKELGQAADLSPLVDPVGETPITISLVNFSPEEFVEREDMTANECQDYLDRDTFTWIHVQGQPKPAELRQIGSLFNLHPLAMEDVIAEGERSKVDTYDGQIMIILGMPTKLGSKIITDQVTLFLGEHFVVSFHSGEVDPFRAVRRRLSHPQSALRTSTLDYLFYVLIDVTIDRGFPILDEFEEEIEAVEQALLSEEGIETFHSLYTIKRELLVLRLKLNPQRETIGILLRDDQALLSEKTKIYLRDVYDHAIRLNEVLDIYRDMTSNMLEVYLSLVNRLTFASNEVQRKATVWALIFAPLTFVTGIYGMNFASMPETQFLYGFQVVFAVMLGVGAGLWRLFRRKRWL